AGSVAHGARHLPEGALRPGRRQQLRRRLGWDAGRLLPAVQLQGAPVGHLQGDRQVTARVAITAAGSGIGLAIGRAFAAQGAAVYVCALPGEAVSGASAEGLVASQVDVADIAALDHWIDSTLDALGGLDVLVNNAGAPGPTALVEDIEADEWQRTL